MSPESSQDPAPTQLGANVTASPRPRSRSLDGPANVVRCVYEEGGVSQASGLAGERHGTGEAWAWLEQCLLLYNGHRAKKA